MNNNELNDNVGKMDVVSEQYLMYPNQINPKRMEAFLKKYPQVEKSMKPFLSTRLMTGYKKWLKWKEKNEDKLGGTPNTVDSPSFGSKTFYKHDWSIAGIDSWAAVFQYLFAKQFNDPSLYSSKNESVNEASDKPMMAKSGNDILVDTTFVQLSNKFGKLDHIWMGDFSLKTKDGDVEFNRVNKQIKGFSGRVHKLTGDSKAITTLLKNMKPKVVKESVVSEMKYSNQTGIKSSVLRDNEFSNLLSPKEQKWARGNDVKIYKDQFSFIFTDGKREMVFNLKKPYSVVKPMGNARSEIKKVYQQTESVNEEVYTQKIKFVMQNSTSSFKNIGNDFKKAGLKYNFSTSPFPHYIVEPGGNKKVAIISRKNEYDLKGSGIQYSTYIATMKESVNEALWPKSKLPQSFQFALAPELKKNFKGVFYSIGNDIYHNDNKVLTVNGDTDSVNSIIKKLKSKIRESVNESVWTPSQKKEVEKLDDEFRNLLAKKGIEPYSYDASKLWKTAGFKDKFKQIFENSESVSEGYHVVRKGKQEAWISDKSYANLMKGKDVVGYIIDNEGGHSEVWVSKKDIVKVSKSNDALAKVADKYSKFESVNEGKKRFKQQDGIGSSKYTISFHDGNKKHKDGSDFFDIKIFKNKQDLEAFKKELLSNKYVSESVNEGVKLSLVDPNTNKFIITLSLDRTYREAEKEVETLNKRLSTSEKNKGLYWKVTSIGESVNEARVIIKSKDGKLHHYPNFKKNDVIKFLTKKGMNVVSNEKDLKSNMDFYVVESIGESVIEEKVYIDFLNKKKGFKQDRIKFNSYEDAVKWARKNFDKFSPDMIKFESITEASRRATDFFGDSKHGKALHRLMKGKWNPSVVEKYVDKLSGGNDVKYARIMDFIAGDLGLNIRKYKTVGEMEPEMIKSMEKLYKDFLTESLDERKKSLQDMIKDADRIKKEYNDFKKEYSKSKTETNKTRLAAKEEQLRRVANAIRQARADEVDAKNESSVVDDQGMQRVGTSLPQTKEDDVELTESAEPKIITQLRDVMKSGYKKLKDPKSGKTMTVDSYSASAIVNVYDALKDPKNKEKFSSMGLLGMQSTAFRLIK